MLKIDDLFVNYGGIKAVRNVSFEVPDGKIVTLIGANGAGKSTILRTITGLVHAASGSITYNDEELTKLHTHDIVTRGITPVSYTHLIPTALPKTTPSIMEIGIPIKSYTFAVPPCAIPVKAEKRTITNISSQDAPAIIS